MQDRHPQHLHPTDRYSTDMHLNSPIDIETFSTPPSTPSAFLQPMTTETRRSSVNRPQSIHIDKAQQQGFQIDLGQSPDPLSTTMTTSLTSNSPVTTVDSISPALQIARTVGDGTVAKAIPSHMAQNHKSSAQGAPPRSPCFVHSCLDKGNSLADWLRDTSGAEAKPVEPVQSRDAQRQPLPPQQRSNSSTSSPSPSVDSSNSLGFIPSPTEWDDEEDGVGSLTRQLAATAVGVREMSKQLGRARVRSNIQNVMIITKARDNRLIKLTRDLALYLMSKRTASGRGLVVYVDHQLRTSKRFDAEGIEREFPDYFKPQPSSRRWSSHSDVSDNGYTSTGSGSTEPRNFQEEGQLRYWTSDMCSKSPQLFDFVVTLGGDGTVLFTSWLFQQIVPPVLPFALGSLGFLTNFDFDDHRKVMDGVLDKGIRVNLRMRFTCTVYRAVKPEEEKGKKKRRAIRKGDTGEIFMKNLEEGGWEMLEGNNNPEGYSKCKDKEIMCYTTRPVESFEVLNDLVVDRGPSPYVSVLELFGDEHHMTTVQADGLTISTPTGSTAYSLSAGGSLVHPEIPALLITPICPHTLSFRPMLLPDSMELRVCVPYNSRSTAWASFDGRGRVELKQGDHIKVTASKFPFPTVCADNQSTDWFGAISRTLKWNERERQKSFVVIEDDSAATEKKKRSRKTDATPSATDRIKKDDLAPSFGEGEIEKEEEEDEDDDDEEEEEEKFDIDDSSPEAAAATDTTAKQASATSSPQHHPQSTSSSSTEDSPKLSTSLAAQRAATILGGGKLAEKHSASGIDSPGRFMGSAPHPPKVHARHIINQDGQHVLPEAEYRGFDNVALNLKSPLDQRTPRAPSHHVHSQHTPRQQSALQQNLVTPNSAGLAPRPSARPANHRRGRSAGDVALHKKTPCFAVYGHDESDSNASDVD